MGLQTVGEYAESESIIGALQMIGVDFAQGYAFTSTSNRPDG